MRKPIVYYSQLTQPRRRRIRPEKRREAPCSKGRRLGTQLPKGADLRSEPGRRGEGRYVSQRTRPFLPFRPPRPERRRRAGALYPIDPASPKGLAGQASSFGGSELCRQRRPEGPSDPPRCVSPKATPRAAGRHSSDPPKKGRAANDPKRRQNRANSRHATKFNPKIV